MKRVYYQIEGEDGQFFTLRDAKSHVFLAYTKEERIKYLKGCSIFKLVDGEAVSETKIIVDNAGNYGFSKTIKL